MKQRIILLLLVSSLFISPILVETQFSNQVQAQTSTTDWWPMYRHDLNHTGVSTSIAPNTNEILWIYSTRHQILSSPAIFEGVVFIGSNDKFIYALNSTTGQLIWKFETKGDILSSPAVENGRIFVSGSGELYTLNASTGEYLWSVEFWGLGQSSPIISDNKVFVCSSFDEKIFAFNVENGLELWNFTIGRAISSPAISNKILYVGSIDEKIYALNSSTGDFIWSFPTTDVIYSSPCVTNGKVFVGSEDGNLYALDANNGNLLWSFATHPIGQGNSVSSSPAVSQGIVYFGATHGFGDEWPWTFYALDTTDGRPIWNYTMAAMGQSSPAVADGKIFIMDHAGGVHALNAMTGDVIWYYDTKGSASSSSPAVADGKVYVGSGNGKIYCFGPKPYFDLKIDPIFYDNFGEPLYDTPNSWSISYTSGVVDASTVMNSTDTFHGGLGEYSLRRFFWNGKEVFSNMTLSTYLTSNMTWTPYISLILPPDLTSTVSSSMSNVGLEINIQGKLTCNEKGVSNTPILLSYSVTEGKTWNEIMLTRTDLNGFYSTVWTPTATGNYVLKAKWDGNSTFPEAIQNTNMEIITFDEQTVCSVASNSTVSGLIYNSTSKELEFTLSGATGTTGYVEASISKALIENINEVKVYLDDTSVDFDSSSLEDAWLLDFIYAHSTHEVVISLSQSSIPFDLSDSDFLPIVLVLSVIAICGIIVYFTVRKKGKA